VSKTPAVPGSYKRCTPCLHKRKRAQRKSNKRKGKKKRKEVYRKDSIIKKMLKRRSFARLDDYFNECNLFQEVKTQSIR
jgi:hypothetical protein